MVKPAACHLPGSTSGRIHHHNLEVSLQRKRVHRSVQSTASLELVFVTQEPTRNVVSGRHPASLSNASWQPHYSNAVGTAAESAAPAHHVPSCTETNGASNRLASSHNALTARIASAQTWNQVADIVQQKGNTFSSVHVAAALTRLTHLLPGIHGCGKGDKGSVERLTSRLLQLALQRFSTTEPQALANTIWAVAKLGTTPTKPWLAAFLQASLPHLPAFKAQHLSMTMWALATLNHPPFKPWMQHFYAACAGQLPKFTAQGLAITLWGLATLSTHTNLPHQWWVASPHADPHHAAPDHTINTCDLNPATHDLTHNSSLSHGHSSPTHGHTTHTPSYGKGIPPPAASWLEPMLDAMISQLPHANSQNLSNALWALAIWQYQPSGIWLEAVLSASHRILAYYQPQGYANTLWAMAQLEVYPEAYWLESFWSCSGPQLSHFLPQQLSSTLWALASLRLQPPEVWRDQVLHVLYIKLLNLNEEFEGQALSNTIWAVSALGWSPEQQWLDGFAARTKEAFVGLGPQSLSNLMVALARLRYRPRTRWRKAFATRTLQVLPRFTPQGLVSLLWALSRLGLHMSQDWLATCSEAALPLLPGMSERECTLLIWALAKKRCLPPPEWLTAFEERSLPFLPTSRAQHLCVMMWSFARLRHRPTDTWLASSLQRAEFLTPTFQCQDCANLLWSLAVMQQQPAPTCLYLLLDRFAALLPTYSGYLELAQVTWAVEALRLQPSQQWLAVVVAHSISRIHSLNLLAMRSLLCMLVACKCDPGTDYLVAMAAAAHNLRQHSTSESVQLKERCYREITAAIDRLQAASMLVVPGDTAVSLQGAAPVTAPAAKSATVTGSTQASVVVPHMGNNASMDAT